MRCFRCQKAFTEHDIRQGLMRPVVVDGMTADICFPCVQLIMKEWVIAFNDTSELKES